MTYAFASAFVWKQPLPVALNFAGDTMTSGCIAPEDRRHDQLSEIEKAILGLPPAECERLEAWLSALARTPRRVAEPAVAYRRSDVVPHDVRRVSGIRGAVAHSPRIYRRRDIRDDRE